jgi:hypothetical protein
MTTVEPITISVSRLRKQRNVLGMNFEGQSSSKDLCDLLADFVEFTYVEDAWEFGTVSRY